MVIYPILLTEKLGFQPAHTNRCELYLITVLLVALFLDFITFIIFYCVLYCVYSTSTFNVFNDCVYVFMLLCCKRIFLL